MAKKVFYSKAEPDRAEFWSIIRLYSLKWNTQWTDEFDVIVDGKYKFVIAQWGTRNYIYYAN